MPKYIIFLNYEIAEAFNKKIFTLVKTDLNINDGITTDFARPEEIDKKWLVYVPDEFAQYYDSLDKDYIVDISNIDLVSEDLTWFDKFISFFRNLF